MEANSFTFDGKSLYEDFGYIIASWSKENSLDAIENNAGLEFNNAILRNGSYMPFTCATYSKSLEMKCSIMRDPDKAETIKDMKIPVNEARAIKKWLNRKKACVLQLEDEDYKDIFWEGSFHVEDVSFCGAVYGFDLTFTTNRPNAMEKRKTFSIDNATNGLAVQDSSDTTGFINPLVEIVCKADGDLTITNPRDSKVTLIKNVVANETITLTEDLQISASVPSHNIADDFNYHFPRIMNTYDDPVNEFTTNLECQMKVSYCPTAKVVF